MDELKFDSTGTDALYLANINRFFAALFTLTIFKNGWPEGKLGSEGGLRKGMDWFREMFEGGTTGNRLHIAARRTARQDVKVRIEKILHYLAVMADEDDIAVMLNSGVVTRKLKTRARRVARPAVAN